MYRNRMPLAIRTGACLAALAFSASALASDPISLTIFHHNDAESQLLGVLDGDYGGIARFGTLMYQLRTESDDQGLPHITLTSGDNFLAGPEFNASLENGVPYYDAVGMDLINYDAMCLGNHDFDFGPSVLADFINSFTNNPIPFLSANLDFSGEQELQDLVDQGRIAASLTIERDGELIGVVGATTPKLSYISSPGDVVVDPDVVGAIQAEVDALTDQGVNKIIVISHLQSVQEDLDIIPMLHDVDIVIAGGGDELLASDDAVLIPGDEGEIYGPYPLTAQDADNNTVYVVTGMGEYRYIGRLIVDFDADGYITNVWDESDPVRVAGLQEPDGVEEDTDIYNQVTVPVTDYVDDLANNIIGESQVELDGRKSEVRTRETNEGNLCADSLLWKATQLAGDYGLPTPDIAIQNGGGIRNNSLIPVGDLTELTTFDILPFANFVCILPAVAPQELLDVVENCVSRVEYVDGRFGQIAGMKVVWNFNLEPGERVISITLNDMTPIVENGQVVDGAPDVSLATIDFLARGGDEYPFVSDFQIVGSTYQQALRDFIQTGLSGVVSEADYPVGGEGRTVMYDSDFDGNGEVDIDDLFTVLANWGPCDGDDCPGDANKDGMVDFDDIVVVLGSWG